MVVGALVKTNSGTKHHGKMGIVIDTQYRWTDPRDEELLVTVLYPDTGEELGWSEYHLEIVE
tara:strand:- start:137 stop:322 length:186 start_codon:yes stop_codon:yes gene_type:complete